MNGAGVRNACLLAAPFWFGLSIATRYHAYWSAAAIFVLCEIAALCKVEINERSETMERRCRQPENQWFVPDPEPREVHAADCNLTLAKENPDFRYPICCTCGEHARNSRPAK